LSKTEPYTLKPITKEKFNQLSPRKTFYHEIIDTFLKSKQDIMELTVPNKSITTLYQGLKAHAHRVNNSFIVRKREGRIFLLRRYPTEEER